MRVDASMGDSEFEYSSDEYGGEGKAAGRKGRGCLVLWSSLTRRHRVSRVVRRSPRRSSVETSANRMTPSVSRPYHSHSILLASPRDAGCGEPASRRGSRAGVRHGVLGRRGGRRGASTRSTRWTVFARSDANDESERARRKTSAHRFCFFPRSSKLKPKLNSRRRTRAMRGRTRRVRRDARHVPNAPKRHAR